MFEVRFVLISMLFLCCNSRKLRQRLGARLSHAAQRRPDACPPRPIRAPFVFPRKALAVCNLLYIVRLLAHICSPRSRSPSSSLVGAIVARPLSPELTTQQQSEKQPPHTKEANPRTMRPRSQRVTPEQTLNLGHGGLPHTQARRLPVHGFWVF